MSEPLTQRLRSGAGAGAATPVFVVGACRSGTTLLRLMLNEHPAVAIPSESHFLDALFRAVGPTATLSGASLERAVDIVASSEHWRNDFGHTAQELSVAVGREPVSVADFIDRVFRLEVGPGPLRWGDKTPAYLHWVDALLTCFPEAQVIAVVRDPRDVYLSLARLQWFGTTTWEIGRYIARNGRLVRRWAERYPSERFRTIRYEDVVLDTESTLRGLCDHLGLPFATEMQAFFSNAGNNVPSREIADFHAKLQRPPSAADVGRWHREGSRLAHAEMEALTVDVIDAFGYERRVPARAVPVLRSEARMRHYAGSPRDAWARVSARLARNRD